MTTFDMLQRDYMGSAEKFCELARDIYMQGFDFALKLLDSEERRPPDIVVQRMIYESLMRPVEEGGEYE